jgi:hypothetical protein
MNHRSSIVVLALGMFSGCSSSEKDPAFDLVYASEWKFSVEGPVSGYLAIVNTGDQPLSLTTLQVKAITDDHPAAAVKITTTPFSTTIPAGQAGGFLTPLSKSVLVDNGLLREKRADTNSDYLSIELANAPQGTYDIKATLELALDGVSAKLPITIHVVPGPTVAADPQAGKRIKLYR